MSLRNTDGAIGELREDIVTGIVRVVHVDGNVALVEPESKSGCSSCALAKGCGTKMISGYFSRNMRPLKIANEFNAQIGDRVEVGMENATILKLSAVIYLFPLVGMTIGTMCAGALRVSDQMSLLSALIGLAGGFLASKMLYSSEYISRSVALIYMGNLASTSHSQNEECQIEVTS